MEAAQDKTKTASFAKLFSYSVLRPKAAAAEIIALCLRAQTLGIASLIVQPYYIKLAAGILQGSGVVVGSVVGFPNGTETPAMKAYQAKAAVKLGAREIIMVMSVPALENDEKKIFLKDIQGVLTAADGAVVKVVMENLFLTSEEKIKAAKWIAESGAHYIRNAALQASRDTVLEDVQVLRKVAAGKCNIEVAGGVLTLAEILQCLKAGARRFTSNLAGGFLREFNELPDPKKEEFRPFFAGANSCKCPPPLDFAQRVVQVRD